MSLTPCNKQFTFNFYLTLVNLFCNRVFEEYWICRFRSNSRNLYSELVKVINRYIKLTNGHSLIILWIKEPILSYLYHEFIQPSPRLTVSVKKCCGICELIVILSTSFKVNKGRSHLKCCIIFHRICKFWYSLSYLHQRQLPY